MRTHNSSYARNLPHSALGYLQVFVGVQLRIINLTYLSVTKYLIDPTTLRIVNPSSNPTLRIHQKNFENTKKKYRSIA